MKDQDIYKKIFDTYNSEKGKNFITHLLRSFLPAHKSSEVVFDILDKDGKEIKMVCCITGDVLQPKTERLSVMLGNHKTLFNGFIDGAKRAISENKANEPLTQAEQDANKIKEEIAEIKVAIQCAGSDKFLSVPAFHQLLNFYMTELLKDNKHLNWIANNERGKEVVKHAKKDGIVTTKKEERVVQKAVEHAKLSLGDMDVLKDLKKKFEGK